MKPSTILILYHVGLLCFARGTVWVPDALGLSGWSTFGMGVLLAVAYSWSFWPRYFAYARRWAA
jgi:uncharacterized membrane protein YeiH